MKVEDLENYEPKGQLIGFPKEIIARMLECQEEQWNKIDVSVFEKNRTAGQPTKGFVWGKTKGGYDFWNTVIRYKNFGLFFEKYPKKEEVTAKYVQVGDNVTLSDFTSTQSSVEINTTEDNSQGFKVGDNVIDFISGQRGRVFQIYASNDFPIFVKFNDEQVASFTFDGKFYVADKYPRLLHYRDDYNYDVIDFNNLPERQKKWRAKKGGKYYSFTSNFKVEDYIEINGYFNNEDYDSGNYFQTKEEAQEMADKFNKYFQEMMQ